MEQIRRFIDILFKSLSILVIIVSAVFVVILFKSCSNTMEIMDGAKKENQVQVTK